MNEENEEQNKIFKYIKDNLKKEIRLEKAYAQTSITYN